MEEFTAPGATQELGFGDHLAEMLTARTNEIEQRFAIAQVFMALRNVRNPARKRLPDQSNRKNQEHRGKPASARRFSRILSKESEKEARYGR